MFDCRNMATMFSSEVTAAVNEFGALFHEIYLRFHRRDDKRSELPNASLAVLEHLSLAGPLTISEMTHHLDRAQSIVSEIVDHLERDRLLERIRDPRDRRRTLVWLTEAGLELLEYERAVLSRDLLGQALSKMSEQKRSVMLNGIRVMLNAANSVDKQIVTVKKTRTTRRRK